MKFSMILATLLASADGIQVTKKMSMYSKQKDEPVARNSDEQHQLDGTFDDAIKNNHFVQAAQTTPDDHEDDTKPANIPAELKANIGFERNYDHSGHDHSVISQDAARVSIEWKSGQKSGPTCMEGDWTILNYQMYSQDDGSLIEDTTASDYPRPLIFQAGRYQVSKCIDIAVQQMRGGEEAVVYCPNDLDIGGGIQNVFHSQFGSRWLDNQVDSKYVIQMSECSINPDYFEKEPELETLTAGFPLYFVSDKEDVDGNKMALTVIGNDLYSPRVTGIHNVKLDKWGGTEHPNLNQQWIWNDQDNSLTNVGIPGSALFEGFNRNLIVYKWRGLHNQRFKYNLGTERLENRYSGRALDIANDKIIAGQNIFTNEPDQTQGQKWKIQYQSKEHGHDHHHEE